MFNCWDSLGAGFMSDRNDSDKEIDNSRLSLLSGHNKSPQNNNNAHSKIIKILKLILPFITIVIIIVVFSWNNMDDTVKTIEEIEVSKPSIGQNELIDPRFESRDKNNNPFSVTASKAISSETDPDLIQMKRPIADVMLKDGAWLAIKGDDGTYWQKDQRLKLMGNVNIYHNEGYEVQSDDLDIDFDKQKASTNNKVKAQGPVGIIEATSMSADMKIGNLIFKGPAKLIIYNSIDLPQPQ